METENKPVRRINLDGLKCDWCESELTGDYGSNLAYQIIKSKDRIYCCPGCAYKDEANGTIARIRMRQEKNVKP